MKLICRGCLKSGESVLKYSEELLNLFHQIVSCEKVDKSALGNFELGLCVYCTTVLLRLCKFKKMCMEAALTLKSFVDNEICDIEEDCLEKFSNKYSRIDLFNFECTNNSQVDDLSRNPSCEDSKKNFVYFYTEDSTKNGNSFDELRNTHSADIYDNKQNVPDEACNGHRDNIDQRKEYTIKSESNQFNDFDSDDDKVLIELESFKKDSNGLSKPLRKKRKRKLKSSGDKLVSKKYKKSKVKYELSEEKGDSHEPTEEQKQILAEHNFEIKKENEDIGGWDNSLEEDRIDETNNAGATGRPIYYHLDESSVQVIKQSIEEINKELKAFRETSSYQGAPYKCESCAKYFMTDISLSLHNKRHSESAGPLICDICSQRYSNHRSLSAHMQTHTDRYKCVFVHSGKRCDAAGDGAEELSCESSENKVEFVCGRVFAARSAAIKHSLKHTGNQMSFHCHLCGKTTNCANTHQKHVRAHTVVKKYECPQCKKEFKNSTTRNLHVMRVHTRERHFSCPSCPMTFVNKTALVAHSIKHSSHRDFYCVECDMHFKSASILKCHLTTSAKHSDPNTFKFQCSLCPKRYPLLYRLRDHMDSAHARKGHCVCDVCGASYHTAAALRRHHRQKHEDTLRERKHRCLICDKAFLTRQTLASHQLIHTGERPFPCDLCGRLFRHKAALWTHNKLVHNKTKSLNTT